MHETQEILEAANRIYDRGHYFPGDTTATREQIVAEIVRALCDLKNRTIKTQLGMMTKKQIALLIKYNTLKVKDIISLNGFHQETANVHVVGQEQYPTPNLIERQ